MMMYYPSSYLMMRIQHHGEDGKELYACEDMTKNQINMRELSLKDSLAVWGEWKKGFYQNYYPAIFKRPKGKRIQLLKINNK